MAHERPQPTSPLIPRFFNRFTKKAATPLAASFLAATSSSFAEEPAAPAGPKAPYVIEGSIQETAPFRIPVRALIGALAGDVAEKRRQIKTLRAVTRVLAQYPNPEVREETAAFLPEWDRLAELYGELFGEILVLDTEREVSHQPGSIGAKFKELQVRSGAYLRDFNAAKKAIDPLARKYALSIAAGTQGM